MVHHSPARSEWAILQQRQQSTTTRSRSKSFGASDDWCQGGGAERKGGSLKKVSFDSGRGSAVSAATSPLASSPAIMVPLHDDVELVLFIDDPPHLAPPPDVAAPIQSVPPPVPASLSPGGWQGGSPRHPLPKFSPGQRELARSDSFSTSSSSSSDSPGGQPRVAYANASLGRDMRPLAYANAALAQWNAQDMSLSLPRSPLSPGLSHLPPSPFRGIETPPSQGIKSPRPGFGCDLEQAQRNSSLRSCSDRTLDMAQDNPPPLLFDAPQVVGLRSSQPFKADSFSPLRPMSLPLCHFETSLMSPGSPAAAFNKSQINGFPVPFESAEKSPATTFNGFEAKGFPAPYPRRPYCPWPGSEVPDSCTRNSSNHGIPGGLGHPSQEGSCSTTRDDCSGRRGLSPSLYSRPGGENAFDWTKNYAGKLPLTGVDSGPSVEDQRSPPAVGVRYALGKSYDYISSQAVPGDVFTRSQQAQEKVVATQQFWAQGEAPDTQQQQAELPAGDSQEKVQGTETVVLGSPVFKSAQAQQLAAGDSSRQKVNGTEVVAPGSPKKTPAQLVPKPWEQVAHSTGGSVSVRASAEDAPEPAGKAATSLGMQVASALAPCRHPEAVSEASQKHPGRQPEVAFETTHKHPGRHPEVAFETSQKHPGKHPDVAFETSQKLPGRHPEVVSETSQEHPGRHPEVAAKKAAVSLVSAHTKTTCYSLKDLQLQLRASSSLRNSEGAAPAPAQGFFQVVSNACQARPVYSPAQVCPLDPAAGEDDKVTIDLSAIKRNVLPLLREDLAGVDNDNSGSKPRSPLAGSPKVPSASRLQLRGSPRKSPQASFGQGVVETSQKQSGSPKVSSPSRLHPLSSPRKAPQASGSFAQGSAPQAVGDSERHSKPSRLRSISFCAGSDALASFALERPAGLARRSVGSAEVSPRICVTHQEAVRAALSATMNPTGRNAVWPPLEGDREDKGKSEFVPSSGGCHLSTMEHTVMSPASPLRSCLKKPDSASSTPSPKHVHFNRKVGVRRIGSFENK